MTGGACTDAGSMVVAAHACTPAHPQTFLLVIAGLLQEQGSWSKGLLPLPFMPIGLGMFILQGWGFSCSKIL